MFGGGSCPPNGSVPRDAAFSFGADLGSSAAVAVLPASVGEFGVEEERCGLVCGLVCGLLCGLACRLLWERAWTSRPRVKAASAEQVRSGPGAEPGAEPGTQLC